MAKLTCPNCYHKGEDVIESLEYVGGMGLVPRIQCRDKYKCWKRWDEQHEFNLNHMGNPPGVYGS